MRVPTAISLAQRVNSEYRGEPESGLMRILSAKQRWSVREFYELTDRIEYWILLELSNGGLIYRHKSLLSHLRLVGHMRDVLHEFVEDRKLGGVFGAGMNLNSGTSTVRRGSVVFISNKNEKKCDKYAYFTADLIVEACAGQ